MPACPLARTLTYPFARRPAAESPVASKPALLPVCCLNTPTFLSNLACVPPDCERLNVRVSLAAFGFRCKDERKGEVKGREGKIPRSYARLPSSTTSTGTSLAAEVCGLYPRASPAEPSRSQLASGTANADYRTKLAFFTIYSRTFSQGRPGPGYNAHQHQRNPYSSNAHR
jgi:hypothetical protein